jgi:hypothetical protein
MTAEFDTKTTARVVESMVLRGDISALSPEERAKFYLQMCDALGLTAATQPFAVLRLNGKEILYPTRGATDQLAAIHRLNREIIDGPRVIDVAGTKMIYAVCRATHPNGRVETAVATVPVNDPLNGLMKAETKAKRRATLSILGLGMLDETEIETIPAPARVELQPPSAAQIEAAAASAETQQQPQPPRERAPQRPTATAHVERLDRARSLDEIVAALIDARTARLAADQRRALWLAALERARALGHDEQLVREALDERLAIMNEGQR